MSPRASRKGKPSLRERRRAKAREEIVEAARELLEAGGVIAFTVADVAAAVGVTKPAIYYYFPTRENLLFELNVGYVEAESDAVCAAIDAADDGAPAVEAAVRTPVAQCLPCFEVFRLIYLHGQLVGADLGVTPEQLDRVHAQSGRLYAALEAKLRAGQEAGSVGRHVHPRRFAVVTHTSALGLLTLEALAEKVGDPLAHTVDDLVDQLVGALTRGAGAG